MEPLTAGRPARYRRWDWAAGAYAEWVQLPASDVVVLEGCGCRGPARGCLGLGAGLGRGRRGGAVRAGHRPRPRVRRPLAALGPARARPSTTPTAPERAPTWSSTPPTSRTDQPERIGDDESPDSADFPAPSPAPGLVPVRRARRGGREPAHRYGQRAAPDPDDRDRPRPVQHRPRRPDHPARPVHGTVRARRAARRRPARGRRLRGGGHRLRGRWAWGCGSLGGEVWPLYAGTFVAGVGIALGGTLLPGLVKELFPPERSGLVTGLYMLAMMSGAGASSALSVPLQSWLGSWQASLGSWSVLALVGAVAWLPVVSGHQRHRAASPAVVAPTRLPWGHATAWLVAAYLSVQSRGVLLLAGVAGAVVHRPRLGPDPRGIPAVGLHGCPARLRPARARADRPDQRPPPPAPRGLRCWAWPARSGCGWHRRPRPGGGPSCWAWGRAPRSPSAWC